jgi:hypothetical protein
MSALRVWWSARQAKRRQVNDWCAAVDAELFALLDTKDRARA